MTDRIPSPLAVLAEEVRSWVRGVGNSICYERSCLTPLHDSRNQSKKILLVDIGGTHTRVVLQTGTAANRKFKLVLDESNQSLVSAEMNRELPLRRFARTLAQAAVSRLPDAVDGLGVIWSNQFSARKINEESLCGVSGNISGVAAGSYLKGEWFSEGISDGLDVGEILTRSFLDQGLAISVFVLANDTVATLNAEPGSSGAVVASTGGNAAAITEDGEIVNTELGGLFTVASRFLLDYEQTAFGRPDCALEQLFGGAFLPRLIDIRGRKLAATDSAVAQFYERRGSITSMPAVAAIIAAEDSPHELVEICRESLRRAGSLASLLVAGALALRRSSTESQVVVDSSLARVFPDFRRGLEESSVEIEPHARLLIKAPISTPEGGEISVPTQGLGLSVLAEYR